jgi:hypothetical protein
MCGVQRCSASRFRPEPWKVLTELREASCVISVRSMSCSIASPRYLVDQSVSVSLMHRRRIFVGAIQAVPLVRELQAFLARSSVMAHHAAWGVRGCVTALTCIGDLETGAYAFNRIVVKQNHRDNIPCFIGSIQCQNCAFARGALPVDVRTLPCRPQACAFCRHHQPNRDALKRYS